MIYGIGTDIVDQQRVAKLLAAYGERFARHVLMAEELPEFRSSRRPIPFLAARFAAKEAFSKAMGTGFRDPVRLRKIRVTRDPLGKPGLAFHPLLEDFVRRHGVIGHYLTLTDEARLTCAVVVLER